MIESLRLWLHAHQAFGATALLAVGALVLSVAAGVAVTVLLPADYFVRKPIRTGFWYSDPALRVTLLVAKNLVGGLVLLAGLVMAVPLVPGPGLLLILLGVGLLDFPGKRALECRILRLPRVLASVNRLRARFGRPPMAIE